MSFITGFSDSLDIQQQLGGHAHIGEDQGHVLPVQGVPKKRTGQSGKEKKEIAADNLYSLNAGLTSWKYTYKYTYRF